MEAAVSSSGQSPKQVGRLVKQSLTSRQTSPSLRSHLTVLLAFMPLPPHSCAFNNIYEYLALFVAGIVIATG